MISTLRRDPAFNDFCRACQDTVEDCRGLSLLSFLIKPVQRLCKYPLLVCEERAFVVSVDTCLHVRRSGSLPVCLPVCMQTCLHVALSICIVSACAGLSFSAAAVCVCVCVCTS
jgi:RhoGEF domain